MAKSTAATRRRSNPRYSALSGSDIYLGHYTHQEAIPIRAGYEALVHRAWGEELITLEEVKAVGFPHRRAVAIYGELRDGQARYFNGLPRMPELQPWQRKAGTPVIPVKVRNKNSTAATRRRKTSRKIRLGGIEFYFGQYNYDDYIFVRRAVLNLAAIASEGGIVTFDEVQQVGFPPVHAAGVYYALRNYQKCKTGEATMPMLTPEQQELVKEAK